MLVLSSTGCGYSLAGRGSFLPAYIKTIGVPLFDNTTKFFEVDEILTNKVRAELIGRGRYKVVPEASGEALFIGTVTNVTLTPTGFGPDRQATRYTLAITVKVEFRDVREDKALWENPGFVVQEEYDIPQGTPGGTQDTEAFLRQDTTALDRISTTFARTIVSAIMEAF
jgi:hypothetical protein